MGGFKARLRRLEKAAAAEAAAKAVPSGCIDCERREPSAVFLDAAEADKMEPARCPRCGKAAGPTVFRTRTLTDGRKFLVAVNPYVLAILSRYGVCREDGELDSGPTPCSGSQAQDGAGPEEGRCPD